MAQDVKKLFIDTDEDIIFIIEEILASDAERILLIVPKHAVLVSSLINLKLLARQLVEHDKSVILVTSSELANLKAEEANLIAVENALDVEAKHWKEAEERLLELKTEREAIKEKLRSHHPKHTENEEDPIPEADVELDMNEPEETTPPPPPKSRLKPKFIKKGGFAFVAGADIAENADLLESEKTAVNDSDLNNIEESPSLPKTNNQKLKTNEVTSSSFLVGRDVSRNTSAPAKSMRLKTDDMPKEKKPRKGIPPWFKKAGVILLILAALLLLINTVFAKVIIDVELEKEKIEVTEQVSGSTDVEEVDITTKKIPVYQLTELRSTSGDAEATGTGNKGEKATGVVDLFNKSPNEIKLSAGHTITTLNYNLNFQLAEGVTIPPRVSEITPSRVENVAIVAADFGDQYNVSDTDVKVQGYDTIQQLSGRIFRAVRGGTSEEITVVSQQDVDKLKESLTNTLQQELTTALEEKIGEGDIKVPDSLVFAEKALEASPKVGEESDSLNITKLEIEATMLYVKQSDLDALATGLITTDFNVESEEDIDADQPASIDNVKLLEGGQLQFDLRKEALVKPNIDEAAIKARLEGKQLSEVGSTIGEIQEVQDYKISYSPFFVPAFLQRMPNSSDRVVVNLNIE